MASSDSLFLFDIAVEELKSFTSVMNFRIRAKFADVFTLKLRDPNELYAEAIVSQMGKKFKKKYRATQSKVAKQSLLPVPSGQSVLIASDVESLVTNMMKYPIELFVYTREDPYTLGMVEVPWSQVHIDYVKISDTNNVQPPALTREKHKLFDEYTSKRVAVVTLKVQVSKLNNDLNIEPRFTVGKPIQEYSNGFLSRDFTKALTRTRNDDPDFYENTGIVKTIYNNGKKRLRKSGRNKQRPKTPKPESIHSDPHSTADEINMIKDIDSHSDDSLVNSVHNYSFQLSNQRLFNNAETIHSISSLVRSQTRIAEQNKKVIGVTRHWSSTSLEIKERLDTLNYIFGNLNGPFGNRVYCVGFFTVEADSPPKTPEQKTPTTGTADTSQTPATDSPANQATPLSHTPKKTPTINSPVQSQTHVTKDLAVSSASFVPIPATIPLGKLETQNKTAKLDQAANGKDSETTLKGKGHYSFKVCGSQCKIGSTNPCFENVCSIDLPAEAAHLISMRKCTDIVLCDHKKQRASLSSSDEPIVIDFTNRNIKDCCVEKVEEMTGEVSAKMKVGEDPCFCTCECTFGFVKKTTYCKICGGYEIAGEEIKGDNGKLPFPCPIFHNLSEKGKRGPSAGDVKTKRQNLSGIETEAKSTRSRATTPDKRSIEKRSVESEKDSKKGKKKSKKDDRFKFNYGYKGIPPQIGHSQCAMPCTGNLYPVPKTMGWLWTADNIPGLKVRPNWRPGAANKHVVRMLRIARYPEQVISKRRRKDTGKKKRPLKRPLLIVQKKDGEYKVTMETMRTFNKPRAINQYPYEDKPLVTYTVGRTDEENRERQKRKERQQRRLEKEQRAFIQGAFHDMCTEICMKTYHQALGILPFAEDPPCPCYPIEPGRDNVDISHSCSCTESTRSSGTTTDDDEWIVEFTPPNAYFNPAYKSKRPVKVNNSTQYNYLDYKVKLLDRFGNPVPRFFIGPDGKQECSDLGGFWGPDKKWLEINVDGYIGPDGRWAPNQFIGPCGEHVDTEGGKFQATNGVWLVVGVDGFVNHQGKWCFYPKQRKDPKKQRNLDAWKKAGGCKGTGDAQKKIDKYAEMSKPSEATWSCFGDASPRTLSHMGIIGHGHDRRLLLSTLERMMAEGEDIIMPQTPKIPKLPKKKGKKTQPHLNGRESYYSNRAKCKHTPPSNKGILAMDELGRKTYFRLKDHKNPRPKERIVALGNQGISVSSFHVPCLSSFINSEIARQEKYEHILQHNARIMVATAGAQTV